METKNIFIILILLLSGTAYSQPTIIVSSKKDLRYIAYVDSCLKYDTYKKTKKEHYHLLYNTETLGEFVRMKKTLGYGSDVTKPEMQQYREDYDQKQKTVFDTLIHAKFGNGNITQTILIYKVYPPKIKVIYQPTLYVSQEETKKERIGAIEYYTVKSGVMIKDSLIVNKLNN